MTPNSDTGAPDAAGVVPRLDCDLFGNPVPEKTAKPRKASKALTIIAPAEPAPVPVVVPVSPTAAPTAREDPVPAVDLTPEPTAPVLHALHLPKRGELIWLVGSILAFVVWHVYSLQLLPEYEGAKAPKLPPEFYGSLVGAAALWFAGKYTWTTVVGAWRCYYRSAPRTPISQFVRRRTLAMAVQALLVASAILPWATLPYTGPYIYRDFSLAVPKVVAAYRDGPHVQMKIAEPAPAQSPEPQIAAATPPPVAPPSIADATPAKPALNSAHSVQKKSRVVTGSLPDKKRAVEYPLDDIFREIGNVCERLWTKVIGGASGTSANSPPR